MCIDISKLLQNKGARAEYEPVVKLQSVSVDGIDYPVKMIKPLKLSVIHTGDQVLKISYSGEAVVTIPCARCLEDVEYHVSFSGEREADMKLPDEKREDAFFVADKAIHLEPLVTDEILMRWPIRVLCREDCKGLCSRCGANLNNTQCDCEKEITDPRMAAISDIFSQFKEV